MHYKYVEGKQAEADAIFDKVIAYNKEAGMFGDVLTSFRFTKTEGGYDAVEIFNSAEAACKYYENFEKCPFMTEVMGLAEMTSQCVQTEITALTEEVNKCAKILEYHPASEGEKGNKYTNAKPDLSKFGKPAFGWAA